MDEKFTERFTEMERRMTKIESQGKGSDRGRTEEVGKYQHAKKNLPDETKAVATGFHEDTEEEVVKILRPSIDVIRMKREKSKIKCPAKPITAALLEFENCEERDKYIRSANMLRMELRERKIKKSHTPWTLLKDTNTKD